MTSRVDQVSDLIGSEICSGVLQPGTALTAEGLQARAGASRTVVREALGVLTSLGLVRVRRRIGYEVCAQRDWTILSPEVMRWRLAGPDSSAVQAELTALRDLLEPEAAALASASADAETRAELARTAAELWSAALAGDRDRFVTTDIHFHRTVCEASGSSVVAALGEVLAEALPPRAPSGTELSHDQARAHLDLADAIVRGDAAEARRLSHLIVRAEPRGGS
ncbi:MAG: FadR/GntR family transcriptional regulator [Mycetocola sp.]